MNQLLKEAFQLRKNLEFNKAIKIYKTVWTEDENLFNDWDGWSYAFCLSKLNFHDKALEVCRKMYPKYPNYEILNSLYAKSIYFTQFKNQSETNIQNLQKAATAILKLSPPGNPYSYTPVAIFGLIKSMMAQMNINWSEIEKWLLKLEPDLLDDKAFKMIDSNGKAKEYASPKEEWYSLMIRTKAGLNQPREVLEILGIARKQNLKWHYNNDIWFARKEAFAFLSLGANEKAEQILRKIITQKKDWFLLFDLSTAVKDNDEKIQLMCKAALAPGKIEHKIKLFQTFAEMLKTERTEKSKNHFELVAAIRKENGWGLPEDLIKNLKELEINPDNLNKSSQIINEIKSYWQEFSDEDQQKRTGTIIKILPNGNSGFVKERNDSFYFNAGKLSGKIKEGDKVLFEITEGFDKKKNKATKMAVNLKII